MQKTGNPYQNSEVRTLLKAFLTLENEEECLSFLQDLMTIKEIQDMSQRLRVAQLLEEGKAYQQISENVSVSSATISRVSRALNYGEGGYVTVLERLKNTES
jgi:TrpR-related protein YerC/YecD